MVRCADGIDVEWHYSDTPMTTVRSEHLERMRSSHILTRMLAHAECNQRQIDVLYRGDSPNIQGRKRRRAGIRIKAMRIEVFCGNVSEKTFFRVFGDPVLKYDRQGTIEALLSKA